MKHGLGCLGAAAWCAFLLAGCGETAKVAVAPLDEGDMIYADTRFEKPDNRARFEAFLAVTESGGNDAVRIVNMTIEGDPVYTDISYKEGKYEVYHDASDDAYASEENRKRRKAAECTVLVQSDRPDAYSEYVCGMYAFRLKE
jgi:hypothetical protein